MRLILTGVLQSHEPSLNAAKAALDAALASQLQQNDVINSEDPDSVSTAETATMATAVAYQAWNKLEHVLTFTR